MAQKQKGGKKLRRASNPNPSRMGQWRRTYKNKRARIERAIGLTSSKDETARLIECLARIPTGKK